MSTTMFATQFWHILVDMSTKDKLASNCLMMPKYVNPKSCLDVLLGKTAPSRDEAVCFFEDIDLR